MSNNERRHERKARLIAEGRWSEFLRRRADLRASKRYEEITIKHILNEEFGPKEEASVLEDDTTPF